MTDEVWYRFHDFREADWYPFDDDPPRTSHAAVRLEKFAVLKHTPKGVWLVRKIGDFIGSDKRFVLKAANKRFACPTIEEAKESFFARKNRQIRILKKQIEHAQSAISLVEHKQIRCSGGHDYIDPTNEIVDANNHLICRHCGHIKKKVA